LVYTDKPLWTKIGKSIAYFGILLFLYTSIGVIFTKKVVESFKFYESKKHILHTQNHVFLGIVNSPKSIKNYPAHQLKVEINQSYIGNFSRNATIQPANLNVITIGIYILGFSSFVLILSISALYVLKKMYYLFLIITFFNFWFIVVSMMMII
jgi:hypothetical protein